MNREERNTPIYPKKPTIIAVMASWADRKRRLLLDFVSFTSFASPFFRALNSFLAVFGAGYTVPLSILEMVMWWRPVFLPSWDWVRPKDFLAILTFEPIVSFNILLNELKVINDLF